MGERAMSEHHARTRPEHDREFEEAADRWRPIVATFVGEQNVEALYDKIRRRRRSAITGKERDDG